jgi:hypothetical protein
MAYDFDLFVIGGGSWRGALRPGGGRARGACSRGRKHIGVGPASTRQRRLHTREADGDGQRARLTLAARAGCQNEIIRAVEYRSRDLAEQITPVGARRRP